MAEEVEAASRPQFGGRLLAAGEDVFRHNAWDNVEWGEEQEREAREVVARASGAQMEAARAEEFEAKAGEFWDKFYGVHQNRFFKERNWLFTEFPDLAPGVVPARTRVYGARGEVEGKVEGKVEEGKVEITVEDPKVEEETLDRVTNDLKTLSLRESESFFGENSSFRIFEV